MGAAFMSDHRDAEAHAATLMAVLGSTGSLRQFVEAARMLLKGRDSDYIDDVGRYLPHQLAVALPRPVTLH
jgi:hypothetical protein